MKNKLSETVDNLAKQLSRFEEKAKFLEESIMKYIVIHGVSQLSSVIDKLSPDHFIIQKFSELYATAVEAYVNNKQISLLISGNDDLFHTFTQMIVSQVETPHNINDFVDQMLLNYERYKSVPIYEAYLGGDISSDDVDSMRNNLKATLFPTKRQNN